MTLRQKLFTVWVFFTVNLRRLFRDKMALFFTFLFPLIFLFVFGGLNSHNNDVSFNIAIINKSDSQFAKNFARLPMVSMMVLPFEPMWMRARAGELNPGDTAPDFDLPTLDKTQQVKLSALRGKPVMLVFGSYT